MNSKKEATGHHDFLMRYEDGSTELIRIEHRPVPQAAAELTDALERMSAAWFLLADAQKQFAKIAGRLKDKTEVMQERQQLLARSQQALARERSRAA